MSGPQWRIFSLVVILVALEIALSPAAKKVVKSIITDPLHPDLADTTGLTRAGAFAAGGLALVAVGGFAPNAATAFIVLLYLAVFLGHADAIKPWLQNLSSILNGGN